MTMIFKNISPALSVSSMLDGKEIQRYQNYDRTLNTHSSPIEVLGEELQIGALQFKYCEKCQENFILVKLLVLEQ